MTRTILLALAFVAATATNGWAEAPAQVIVCSTRHLATVQRIVGEKAIVIELLPEKIADDLTRAGERLAALPHVDVCVWDSSADSQAEAMWVERLGGKHGGCQTLDLPQARRERLPLNPRAGSLSDRLVSSGARNQELRKE